MMGVDPDRIRSIWTFEQSTEFSEADNASLRLARDAASVPNQVEPEHFVNLRKYWSDRQIVEMLSVISLAGWYNRWNDSIATVTDQESVDWAEQGLRAVGWELGKHSGAAHEQRKKTSKVYRQGPDLILNKINHESRRCVDTASS